MGNKKLKIILGSKSEGRQAVLKNAGYEFDIVTTDINEEAIRHKDPQKLALALANKKADAIIKKIKEPALLITADQIVICGHNMLGKPKNEKEARKFIHGYEKYPMETISSIVVTNTETGQRAEGIDIAKVYFKSIPDRIIDQAIKTGRIMRCAGAMRCEDKPFSDYIQKFEGTKDSTSGLPLKLLKKLIKKVSE